MVKISFFDPDETPRSKPATRKTGQKKTGFTMDWISELGWEKNPFRTQETRIAGLEEERKEINLFFVKKRTFGVLTGSSGVGKTTLLRWLYDELSNYNDIDQHFIDASIGSDADFLERVYAPFKGLFGSKLPDSHEQLVEIISKKAKGRYVLLVDNADHLEEIGWAAIDALLRLPCSIIVSVQNKKSLPANDELGITLGKPDVEAYKKILSDRIQSVGGHDIHPFTETVVKRMAKETSNVKEFLELAEETAINIALKHATLDDDVDEQDLADAEEEKAERKKGIKRKEDAEEKPKDAKSEKKRKYDALIESLIDE